MFLLMEAVCRNSYDSVMLWIMESTPLALYNCGLILLSLTVLLFLFGRVAPAVFIGNLFYFGVSVVQHLKLELRSDPIKPSDLEHVDEGLRVASTMFSPDLITDLIKVCFLLVVAALPLLMLGLRILRKRPLRRLFCLVISCAALFFYGQSMTSHQSTRDIMFAKEDYEQRGFLVAFLSRAGDAQHLIAMHEPQGYTREAVEQALEPYAGTKTSPAVLPNILFVMSESLYDITQDLELSQDPIPYFRELQETYWGGEMLTKVLGGGTAIVEYEVLTGYPIEDTGTPYNTSKGVIRPQMDSIISVLHEYGYHTHAMHPNLGAFYGRDTAYYMMGFDECTFSEHMSEPPKEVFPYPSDEYLFDQVINAYENRPKDKPWFFFTITYQNHGGYAFESDFSAIEIKTELSETQHLNAHNYANMLRLSDDALSRLVSYFDESDEPTIIVMWGDHAPFVRRMGIDVPENEIQALQYYTTPILIYNNYGLDVDDLPSHISSNRLGAMVLNLLGMDSDAYFNYLASDDAVNLTLFNNIVHKDGVPVRDPVLYEQEAAKLRLLHYDRLMGERYGEGI